MSFKAFNDLAPVQSLWLHIFTYPHLYPTTLATPVLSVILPQSYSFLAPHICLGASLFFLESPLFLRYNKEIAFSPKSSFVTLLTYLYAIHSILFVPLSCFLLFILLFSVYLIVFPIKLFLRIRDYDFVFESGNFKRALFKMTIS